MLKCKIYKRQAQNKHRRVLYIKDKNRDDLYYWVCERKEQKETKCTARATKNCIEDQHKIRKFDAKQNNHHTLTPPLKKLPDLVG